jgi:hypothetical protein
VYWGDVGPDSDKDSLETRGSKGYDELNQAKRLVTLVGLYLLVKIIPTVLMIIIPGRAVLLLILQNQ